MDLDPALEVQVGGAWSLPLAAEISLAIHDEVARGAVGMAERPAALLQQKMLSGDALVALGGGTWLGFCCLGLWDGGRFVATSGLIVRPDFRGKGVARRLKEAALELALRKYPAAKPFGLTTSDAVSSLNERLGFLEVSYSELPRDPAFWESCATCPHHGTLLENAGTRCHCRAWLLPAAASDRPRQGV